MSANDNDDNIERYSYEGITFPQYLTGGVRDDAPLWVDNRSVKQRVFAKHPETE